MKTIILTILLSFGLSYSQQFLPGKASITPSKSSVLSTEEFTVTYSLTEVEGYYYVGVMKGYFETIGKDRWEGEIKAGETKNISFRLKLKESYNSEIDELGLPLNIGFYYRPFDERILGDGGQFETVIIHISDFESFNLKNRTKDIDTTNNCIHEKKVKTHTSTFKSNKKIIKVPNSIDQE